MSDGNSKTTADLILHRAISLMEECGIPVEVALDRLTTAAAAAHFNLMGAERAAGCFRQYADKIEGGLFDQGAVH